MKSRRTRGWLAASALSLLALLAPGAGAELPDPARFGVVVETGDIKTVRAWLDEGLDPEYLADRIGTGLMIAAWEGNIPMMELFVSRGADVNGMNGVREQALLHAAWKGQVEAVRWLLARGARIDRDGQEWSALHYAAFAGHEQVVRLLLERGADINARAPNGASPLMMAAREGQERIARHLVERGADTSIRSDWGDDATTMAMRYDHVRIAKVVSTPEQFAEVARQPKESFGPPARSVPASSRAEALRREMEFQQRMGNLTPEARRDYLAVIAVLQKEEEEPPAAAEGPPAEPPKALEITAKRGAPGEEKAELIYPGGSAAPVPEAPPAAPKPAASKGKKPAAKKK